MNIVTAIQDLFRWAFWNTWYLPRVLSWKFGGRQKLDLADVLITLHRTRRPWIRFKPYVYRNEAGKLWEIGIANESDYAELMMIPVDAMRSQETGEIVGFHVYDEVLREPDYYKSPYPHQRFKDKCKPTSSGGCQTQPQAISQLPLMSVHPIQNQSQFQ